MILYTFQLLKVLGIPRSLNHCVPNLMVLFLRPHCQALKEASAQAGAATHPTVLTSSFLCWMPWGALCSQSNSCQLRQASTLHCVTIMTARFLQAIPQLLLRNLSCDRKIMCMASFEVGSWIWDKIASEHICIFFQRNDNTKNKNQ